MSSPPVNEYQKFKQRFTENDAVLAYCGVDLLDNSALIRAKHVVERIVDLYGVCYIVTFWGTKTLKFANTLDAASELRETDLNSAIVEARQDSFHSCTGLTRNDFNTN